MGDVVGPGQGAVHAVERRRLGRAQVGADLVELVVAQGEDAAVLVHRRLDRRPAGGRRGGGEEVLEAVLDPLDRRTGLARGQAHQHRIGEHRLLDAEAAARVAGHAVAQLVAGHLERERHHRVQRERAHEVGHDVVAAVIGPMLGDDDTALDRRAGVARVAHGQGDPARRAREGLVGRAIAEATIGDDVAADRFMQDHCRLVDRGVDLDERRQGCVVDLDEVESVLGAVAVFGDDHGDRFAGIADAVDRERPVLHRLLDTDDEGLRPALHVLAGEHGTHARHCQRAGGVDAAQFGVRIRTAQDGGVQRARPHTEVVGELAAACQQGRVLQALHAAAGVALGGGRLGWIAMHAA